MDREQHKQRVMHVWVGLALLSIVSVLVFKFYYHRIDAVLIGLLVFLFCWIGGWVATGSYQRAFIAARIAEGMDEITAISLWRKKYNYWGWWIQ